MSDVFFKTAAGQPAFTVEVQNRNYTVRFPFGTQNPDAIIVEQPLIQTYANYAQPAGTATLTLTINGSSRTLYFAEDVNFRDFGGGVQTWTRIWATIPPSWAEPQAFPYLYPAYAGAAVGTAFAATAIAASGAPVSTRFRISSRFHLSSSGSFPPIAQRIRSIKCSSASGCSFIM